MKTKKLVIYGLFAALSCVATVVIRIPSPSGGYVNLGDCIVLLSGFMLCSLGGAFAVGIGSALADIFSGFPIYAIVTFILKTLMALCAFGLIKKFGDRGNIRLIIYSLICEIIMAVGYFVFESFIYGVYTAYEGAFANFMQSVFGIVGSVVLYKLLSKNGHIIKSLKKFL